MSETTTALTVEQQLAALQAENDKLKGQIEAKRNQPLTLKVSDKGAISVYGMGRFPTTLYRQQMEKLLAIEPEIRAFIKANEKKLTVKE